MKIGVCTGGGDCPGLNASIRAIVKYSQSRGISVTGILNSFQGFLESPPSTRQLESEDVTDILNKGGTILGTHNKGNLFIGANREKDIQKTLNAFMKLDLDALIVIGGEGTQGIAAQLIEAGLPIIGIPKTIDNDLPGTDQTIGFSSCLDIVSQSVINLQSTAESHDRVMILEVMGRDSGYIALHGGIAGGAHVILIPEIPFSFPSVLTKLRERQQLGRKYSVLVVSEGAYPVGETQYYKSQTQLKTTLGGIGQHVASEIAKRSNMETRVTVLGHLQRGGQPNATDKILASQMAIAAVDLVEKKKFSRIITYKDGSITSIPYNSIVPEERRKIPQEDPTLKTARGLGICLGD